MRIEPSRRACYHYGWVVVFAGTLVAFACLGIGRFALGMLLPAMGEDLGLSYGQMGFIGTGNFVGYLVAVLASGPLVRRFGERTTITVALGLVGVSLLGVSRAGTFASILLLYLVTGLGSGASNVTVMGLVSHWFVRRYRGRAAGLIVCGSGFGIVLSGLLIPVILGRFGAGGWRVGWLVLGGIVLVLTTACGALLRNRPEELGLTPVGATAATAAAPTPVVGREDGARWKVIGHLGAIYFLFGFTYVIYATFIVTTLVQERGFSEQVAGTFWTWVGLLSLVSGPVFGALSDHMGRKVGLGTVFVLQAAAYLLVGLDLPDACLYLSIGLYGIVAWSIPTIMAAAVGDYMGPARAVSAFGTITFIFGLGQIAGPAAAGMMAERSGSFSSAYLLAAALVVCAVGLTAVLPKVRGRDALPATGGLED